MKRKIIFSALSVLMVLGIFAMSASADRGDGTPPVGGAPVANISGGTFTSINADATGDGVAVYNIEPVYVAQIGETRYETLEAALSGAGSDDMVQLLSDVEVTDTLQVTGDCLLDLNGHTLIGTAAANPLFLLSSYDFRVIDSGETKGKIAANKCAFEVMTGTDPFDTILTINYGVTVESETDCCIFIYSNGTATAAKAEIYGTLISKGQHATIQGQVNDKSTQTAVHVYRNASVISENSIAIYHPGMGMLNIRGGTVTAAGTAIEAKGGKVTISGGMISTTAGSASHIPNDSGSSTYGYALAAVDNIGYTSVNVTINGGTFNGPVAMLDGDTDAHNNTNEISILGGIFSTPVPKAYCKAGYIPTVLGDGTYGVKEIVGLEIAGTITGWNDKDTRIYLYNASMTDLAIRQDIRGAAPTGLAATSKGSVMVNTSDSRLYDQTYSFAEVDADASYKLAVYRKGHGIHVTAVDVEEAGIPLDTTVYLWGDVNMDGKQNIADSTIVTQYIAKKTALTDHQIYEIADINTDDRLNIADATMLTQYIAKKITSFD